MIFAQRLKMFNNPYKLNHTETFLTPSFPNSLVFSLSVLAWSFYSNSFPTLGYYGMSVDSSSPIGTVSEDFKRSLGETENV